MAEPGTENATFAKAVAWLLRIQALLVAVTGLLFAAFGGRQAAIAALCGGAIGLFLTAVTGLRVVLSQGEAAKSMVWAFYRAMALKFVLAMILFVIVAIWFAGYFLPVISGYAVTLLANWLAMRQLTASAGHDDRN